MAVPSDTSVLPVVRSLASDPDPVVRIGAARILAPYDQPLAQSLLEAAGQDPNPSVRELASQALATRVAGDFASLRRLLRSPDAREPGRGGRPHSRIDALACPTYNLGRLATKALPVTRR